jgi:hypothetical protein
MRIPAGSCPCSRIARPDEPIEYFSEKFGDVVRPVNGYEKSSSKSFIEELSTGGDEEKQEVMRRTRGGR